LHNEFYSYTYQMKKYLEAQDNRISHLEAEIQELRTQIAQLEKKPSVNVERLEYKFDQMKVETLEGTLNIGLNPGELGQMDEFAVNGIPPNATPFQFPGREEMIMEINTGILENIDDMINQTEKQSGASLDPSYRIYQK
jgi:spore germination protein PC